MTMIIIYNMQVPTSEYDNRYIYVTGKSRNRAKLEMSKARGKNSQKKKKNYLKKHEKIRIYFYNIIKYCHFESHNMKHCNLHLHLLIKS